MSSSTSRACSTLTVAAPFLPFVDEAIGRFAYLHPAVSIEKRENGIVLDCDTAANMDVLKQEFTFALYRQKIYAETLPLRRALIKGVMGS